MKNYWYSLVLVLFGSMLIANCDCKHLCSNRIPELSFTKFDTADLRVIIISEYSKNGNFDHVINTKIYSNSPTVGPDTNQLVNNTVVVNAFSDYLIDVPAVAETWHLKNITLGLEHKDAGDCTGGMTYDLNGTHYDILFSTANKDLPGLINISK